MAILRFEPNVATQVRLKFPSGRHVDGKFGEQVMFSLLDGNIMYVPVIVEKQLQALQVRRGQPVEICKQQEDGKTEWKVALVKATSAPAQPPAPKPAARAQANGSNGHAKPQAAAELLDGTQDLDHPDTDPPRSQLEHALKISLEAAKRAEQFSHQIGHPIQFDKDDIRLLAQTLVINNRGRAA
jgi:hypothetical protein